MDISRLLGYLQDIHDAPDDSRDFVAFEKRPDMIAAGVPAEAFDGFNFGSKPAVQREIGLLSGGPIRAPETRAPMQRPIIEGNPRGFVSVEDALRPTGWASTLRGMPWPVVSSRTT